MRIAPYEHIYLDNVNSTNDNYTNFTNSSTQSTNNNTKSNNNILGNLLKNPQSINLIKNFLPMLSGSKQDNNQQPNMNGLAQLMSGLSNQNANTDQNASRNNENSGINFDTTPQFKQSNGSSTHLPEINPQYSIENLMKTPAKQQAQKDKSLDYSREFLIKQMQLHQNMLNQLKQH